MSRLKTPIENKRPGREYSVLLGERIARVSKRIGGKRKLASTAGVKENQIYRYIAGKNIPGVDVLVNISKAAGVNIEWLSTGEGPVFSKSIEKIVETSDVAQSNGQIPFYDVRQDTDFKAFMQGRHSGKYHALSALWINRLPLISMEKLAFITATGDAMEPSVMDGSLLLVDRSQRTALDGCIFVLGLDRAVIIRRIQLNVNGSLLLISDNRCYEKQIVSKTDAMKIMIMGKIISAENTT